MTNLATVVAIVIVTAIVTADMIVDVTTVVTTAVMAANGTVVVIMMSQIVTISQSALNLNSVSAHPPSLTIG